MTKLVIAYDKGTFDGNDHRLLALLAQLPNVMVKVGLEAIYARLSGTSIADLVLGTCQQHGVGVFFDAKLSDIGNTVAGASEQICRRAGVWMFSVMASISDNALRAAKEASAVFDVLCVGITVLTDIDRNNSYPIFSTYPTAKVCDFARRAREHNLGGIVCSGGDLWELRERGLNRQLLTVAADIRPPWYDSSKDDQKRTTTPAEAVRLGADYIVVGLPIMRQETIDKRLDAVKRILDEMASAA